MPTATAASQPATKPKAHKHPEGAAYWFTCPACRAEDKERSAPDFKQIADDALESTTFMIPMNDYDNQICRAYLLAKYPDAPYITSALNLDTLTGWEDAETIVVVRRDVWPKYALPGFKRQKDEEGKFETVGVPPETFIGDIVEMAPIYVKRVLAAGGGSKANRFAKAKLNHASLMQKFSEYMTHPYRPGLPYDPKDTVMNFVFA